MDFLILSPPVCPPSEPPSGAFMLAAGLSGRGFDVGLLDLSLEFFHQVFNDQSLSKASVQPAMSYLLNTPEGYDSMRHRGAAGVLHKRLGGFSKKYPGWALTLMDFAAPVAVHNTSALHSLSCQGIVFFERLWVKILEPALRLYKPKKILISLAYLSQLAASIDLVRFLESKGIEATIGGSLPSSLALTGNGLAPLKNVFKHIVTGDGLSIVDSNTNEHMLDKLRWPTLLSNMQYISSRPVIPLTLSTGCFWRRCLFCPDRTMGFHNVPQKALEDFFLSMPGSIREARPVIHLLDSAIPPSGLRRFVDLMDGSMGFYGFARPTEKLLENHLLEKAADKGCLMLQLGVESGSKDLLERFKKGINPEVSQQVLNVAAQLGIRNYIYLLFGLPTETDTDRQATEDFMARNSNCLDFFNLSLFNLPRDCELTERATEFDIKVSKFGHDDDDENGIRLYWSFQCNGISPRKEARDFLSNRFEDVPGIKEAVRRTPRWFRAAHMAMMKVDGRR